MSLLIPVMLFGWIPFSILCFSKMEGHRAVLFSYIGAILFLPSYSYELPVIPAYTKETAAGLGVLLGIILFDNEKLSQFRIHLYDLPMLIWLLCPLASSLSNGFGLEVSTCWNPFFRWGLPYFYGRLFFTDQKKITDLAKGFLIGGLIYIPLCWYEVRMSPQLSNIFYGFFPHSFVQQFRAGGFRPVVFMPHGIPVALWMAVTATLAFWLWKSRKIEKFFQVPMGVHVALLIFTVILCKTSGALIVLLLGIFSYYVIRFTGCTLFLQLLLLLIPTYTVLRAFALMDRNVIQDFFARYVSQERLDSLSLRLLQEDLFSVHTQERLFFGWGSYGRNRPVDPYTGETLIGMVDSLWLIVFSSKGVVGLYSMLSSVLLGPLLTFGQINFGHKNEKGENALLAALGLAVVQSMIDGLLNGMPNASFLIISGALLSRAIEKKR